MISIKYHVENGKLDLTVSGHAGYAKPGTDIVCSAVSILTYTLMKCAEIRGGDNHIETKEGYSHITTGNSETVRDFITILEGYRLMAENYPDYVEVREG